MFNSFATPWTVACQAPLSMWFPQQEYRSGLPFPPPWDFPDPGIEPMSSVSPALQAYFFYLWTTREARSTYLTKHFLAQYVQGKLKKNESMFEYLKSFQTLRNTTLRSLRNPWCSQTLSFTRHGSGLPEIPLAVPPGLSRTSTRNTDSHGLMTWATSFKLENSWISRKVYTRKRQPPT